MAYTTQTGLGLDIGEAASTALAVSKVVRDPALPEITCNVLRLNKVIEGKDPGPPCKRKVYTIADKRKGVGLHTAIAPLRIATWARQNPAIAIGAGVGTIALFVGVGYLFGKASKR